MIRNGPPPSALPICRIGRASVQRDRARPAGWLIWVCLCRCCRTATLPDGGLIARLGLTEYLVEGNSPTIGTLMQTGRVAGVYPVLRQDASFALCGARVNDLLLQTCNVDFRMLDAEPSKLILTSMAGVGVTILATRTGDQPCYRLWCDGTFGRYLWDTLTGIAEELGGGCIGLDALP
jgi:sarcosine oxidase subunit gamma